MKKSPRRRVDIDLQELDGIVDSAREKPLSPSDHEKLKTALHALVEQLTPEQRSSEKLKDLMELGKGETTPEPAKEKTPRKGHGRNGADAFTAADQVQVAHDDLKHGDACPECPKGKVYTQSQPKTLVRIIARAPMQATVYSLERLRCNLCGQIFTAQQPEDVGADKYDETVSSMVALLKYGTGLPFNRIELMQKQLGVPLPASNQWELVEEAAELVKPVMDEMIRQAATGKVLHTDDTSMRILKLERPPDDERTGVFTTGLISVDDDRTVALFFTGRQHAGENLADVLQKRSRELGPPIQMSDALSRNAPKLTDGAEVLLANCLAHGRRNFVDVAKNFPTECRHVLEQLGLVYAVDARARAQGLDARARLKMHQAESQPVMKALHQWLNKELDEKRIEPNSSLGKAVKYLLRHWKPLTLFLREAGAPLDNNICERALKTTVLHRKNALFYKTANGAEVGDAFMSLIHTCRLNDVNPFDYLNGLQRRPLEVQAEPAAWMPWNYRARLCQPTVSIAG